MSGRGGKRAGAGRKPAPAGTVKVRYNTKLSRAVVAYLQQCENGAETVDQAIRRSKDFRSWAKTQGQTDD